MGDQSYNPNSIDATLSRMEERQKVIYDEIKGWRAETRSDLLLVRKDVDGLKSFRDNLKGKVAIVSAVVGGAVTASVEWAKMKLGGH